MKHLPERSSLGRQHDAAALNRVRDALPDRVGLGDAELIGRGLRLHHAQSCIAREHGFLQGRSEGLRADAHGARGRGGGAHSPLVAPGLRKRRARRGRKRATFRRGTDARRGSHLARGRPVPRLCEEHGYGDNVVGTLSWASLNEPVAGGDWAGCAEALAHDLPAAEDPEWLWIDGRRRRFGDEVTEALQARTLHEGGSRPGSKR